MERVRDEGIVAVNRSAMLRVVGVTLTAVVAVALMVSMAFAHSSEEYSPSRSVRAQANPSMNVALWYAPAEVNGVLLASRALLEDANPGMNVAQWYAPAAVNGALIASQVLNAGANPSMNVALWYAPVQSEFEALLCLAERAGEICQ